jgi:hypothetical protein
MTTGLPVIEFSHHVGHHICSNNELAMFLLSREIADVASKQGINEGNGVWNSLAAHAVE